MALLASLLPLPLLLLLLLLLLLPLALLSLGAVVATLRARAARRRAVRRGAEVIRVLRPGAAHAPLVDARSAALGDDDWSVAHAPMLARGSAAAARGAASSGSDDDDDDDGFDVVDLPSDDEREARRTEVAAHAAAASRAAPEGAASSRAEGEEQVIDSELRPFVVIVGAGPTGVCAALCLQRLHVPCVLLERELDVFPQPRAGAVHSDVMRVLDFAGVADRVLPDMLVHGVRFEGEQRRELLTLSGGTVARDGFASTLFFYQPTLERSLRACLDASLVRILSGWTVRSVEHLPRGKVRVVAKRTAVGPTPSSAGADADAPLGALRAFTAKFVLGCDGARSCVREAMGATMSGASFAQRWLVCDTEYRAADDARMARDYTFAFGCTPHEPYVLCRLPERTLRFEFLLSDSPLPAERSSAPLDVPDAAAIEQRIARFVPPSDVTIRRAACYTHHSRTASPWYARQVFLLGDAAHLMPPFAGHGMSSGMRDALAVAWRLGVVYRAAAHFRPLSQVPLEYVHQPRNPDASPAAAGRLLASYEDERLPFTAKLQAVSLFNARAVQTRSRVVARVRDAVVRALRCVPGSRLLFERLKLTPPLTGGLFYPQARMMWPLRSISGVLSTLPIVDAVFERLTDGAGQLCPNATARVLHASPVAESPLPPVGSVLRMDAALGTGFALVGMNWVPGAHLAAASLSALAHALDMRFVNIESDARAPRATATKGLLTLALEGGAAASAWRRLLGGGRRVALVRPDRFVYGVAPCGSARDLVHCMLGDLFPSGLVSETTP